MSNEPNNLEWQWLDEVLGNLLSLGEMYTIDDLSEAKLAITAKISEIVDTIIGEDDLLDKKYPLSIKQDIKSRNHLRYELRKRKDEVLK